MNITFLVGNGFDISAGLETSFKDFCKWYCAQPNDSQIIEQFKNEIKSDIDSWADFEIKLGEYSENFSISSCQDYVECFEDARAKVAEYMSLQTENAPFSIYKQSLADGIFNFYSELKTVDREALNDVIAENAVEPILFYMISFNYTNVLDRMILSSSTKKGNFYINSSCSLSAYINGTVLHIHGNTSCPIMGVSNDSQFKNSYLLKDLHLRQTVIKSEEVDALGEMWYQQALRLIQNSKIICIFGMSLGRSDVFWWDTIIKKLEEDPVSHLIVFWHTDSKIKTTNLNGRIKEEILAREEISKLFCLSKEQSESLKSQIHVIINSQKVLKVDNLKSEITI